MHDIIIKNIQDGTYEHKSELSFYLSLYTYKLN